MRKVTALEPLQEPQASTKVEFVNDNMLDFDLLN